MRNKTCTKCGNEKSLSEFHKYIHSKDGYKTICKKCISDINKTKEVKEKNKEREREWRLKNKDKISEYKKNSYIKNKETILKKNSKKVCHGIIGESGILIT